MEFIFIPSLIDQNLNNESKVFFFPFAIYRDRYSILSSLAIFMRDLNLRKENPCISLPEFYCRQKFKFHKTHICGEETTFLSLYPIKISEQSFILP